jgi:hypothetical protein
MRKIFIGIIIGVFSVCLLSLSSMDHSIPARILVPAKPLRTIYVKGIDNMYKYLKKGYQVQNVIIAHHEDPFFLMVLYKLY